MKLKATLEPLKGKYYGTEIKLDNGTDTAYIQVWVNRIGNYKASTRELEGLEEGEEYEICDDHYESQAALIICNKIVEALDGFEIGGE